MRDWWLDEVTPSSITEAIPFQLRCLFQWWRGHYLQTEVMNFTKWILLVLVYIPPIQVEAVFEGEATSTTGEMIIKLFNERLMTWRSNSIEHNKSDPLPAPMSLPMIKRTLFTDRGQEIHQANPSPMMKSALTEENIETLLAKEWELKL